MSQTGAVTKVVPKEPIDKPEVVVVEEKPVPLTIYVASVVDSFKSKLSSFKGIADSKIDNGDKLLQASMLLSDVASTIVNDYTTEYPSQSGNSDLPFNVVSQLISDVRVGKSLGLSPKLWDEITSLKQFETSDEFNGFITLLRNRDEEKANTAFCRCLIC
jgi:hypothetical protein